MKRLIILSSFLLYVTYDVHAQSRSFLENIYYYIETPSLFSLNQEEGHSPMVVFNNKKDALSFDWNKSNDYMSLNGEWKFKWFELPDLVPKLFFDIGFDDINWEEIKVPSNWEMEGYGDPVFRNTSHPFQASPPFVPREYNPTGAYRRTFSLPANWGSKEIFLRVEAATSASFLWINGNQVGFNEGANIPAEYNITDYLTPGANTIAICVTKYSAGTYLESQDMWRLSGIFRDVYLFATPKLHMRDYYIATDLDDGYKNANLNITVDIKNYSTDSFSGYSVKGTLFDSDKKTPVSSFKSDGIIALPNDNRKIKFRQFINDPKKWSSESPNLYYLTLELISPENEVTEVIANRIGFKKVEIKNQAILVNGMPVKFNGVNSHMQHPETGRSMDTATIYKDLKLMKQFNINLVRTAHYPPNIDYLNRADEIGMYIVDETGNEAHATEFISNLPEWTRAYKNRLRRMVLRDRNHPSIVFWSAGNESGIGNNICQVIKEGKELDPTRLFMYGGNTDDVGWKNEVPCEDIVGPRYATPYELRTRIAEVPESQDPRPSFMDEYIAATGNGAGGLDEYWELIYQYPRLSGGAIWDFVSPGLTEKLRLIEDKSHGNINVALKGRAKIVKGKFNNAILLNGHDQWIDVYRDPSLDITGRSLTLSAWIYPNKWNGNNPLITKGSNQFGLNQSAKDSLEMYVSGTKKGILKIGLKSDWEGSWHHIGGIYDGAYISLYIDGELAGKKPFTDSIVNTPFPISIGHLSDIQGQEFSGYQSNTTFDRVAIFDRVLSLNQLLSDSDSLKNMSKLWLDMDNILEKGNYYSMGMGGRTYGLVWPDRTPQPELYQVKKSAQPVKVSLLNYSKDSLEVWNRYCFTNLSDLKAKWKLLKDGDIVDQGELILSVEPLQKARIKVPSDVAPQNYRSKYWLIFEFSLKNDLPWAPKGFVVAWDQIELPMLSMENQKKEASNFINRTPIKKFETDDYIVVTGRHFKYTFNKRDGTFASFKYLNQEFFKVGPSLNVWRAPLANDYDLWASKYANLKVSRPGIGSFPASGWYSYGLDRLSSKLDDIKIGFVNEDEIIIEVLTHSEGTDYRTAFDSHFKYTITSDGKVTIDHMVIPKGLMPNWLPKIGLQWIMKKEFNNVIWFGRGPFENYPDRKTGAAIGVYKNTVQEFNEAYLIPQDYGCRTDNYWVKLEGQDGTGLKIEGSNLFNFSAQEFSTDNLSRARYQYQLVPIDGFVFNLDYATSGVGETATSVLSKYRVYPHVYHFVTFLEPYRK